MAEVLDRFDNGFIIGQIDDNIYEERVRMVCKGGTSARGLIRLADQLMEKKHEELVLRMLDLAPEPGEEWI